MNPFLLLSGIGLGLGAWALSSAKTDRGVPGHGRRGTLVRPPGLSDAAWEAVQQGGGTVHGAQGTMTRPPGMSDTAWAAVKEGMVGSGYSGAGLGLDVPVSGYGYDAGGTY